MKLFGEILFALLVLANIATIVKLGWPWTYQDRGVSWYLWLTAWSAAAFDGTFLFALLAKASGPVVQVAFLLSLSLRVMVSVWLLWMVSKPKEL